MNKKKLCFINPTATHPIFIGWRYFFSRYFNFHTFSQDNVINDFRSFNYRDKERFGTHHKLKYKSIMRLGKNFFIFYDTTTIKTNKSDILIIGDILTNSLSYLLRRKNVIFYSEFFDYKKSLWKKIFLLIIGLYFRRKKILVPSILSQKTFQKISSRIFYLPEIYYGKLFQSKKRNDGNIKMLFVGRMSNKYKNIDFLIRNYLFLKEKYKNISLTLVGTICDDDFYDKYQKYLESGDIIFLGKVRKEDFDKMFCGYDVFILASDSEPIGAVIQEAMAHSCAIIVSDTTGASCYIEERKNGYIFKTNDNNDFCEKLEKIINNKKLLESFKKESLNIIKRKYRYKNEQKMKEYYTSLKKFIEN